MVPPAPHSCYPSDCLGEGKNDEKLVWRKINSWLSSFVLMHLKAFFSWLTLVFQRPGLVCSHLIEFQQITNDSAYPTLQLFQSLLLSLSPQMAKYLKGSPAFLWDGYCCFNSVKGVKLPLGWRLRWWADSIRVSKVKIPLQVSDTIWQSKKCHDTRTMSGRLWTSFMCLCQDDTE